MPRGPLGGPRPFADDIDLVIKASLSIGALDSIEKDKRDVTDREVAEIEAELRDKVIKSFGSGPATTKIDVENIPAKGMIKIYLGREIKRKQIHDMERVMEMSGYKMADYTIKGE